MGFILLLLYCWNFLLLGNCFLLAVMMIRTPLLFMIGRLIIFCILVLFLRVRSTAFHGRMNYSSRLAGMITLNSGHRVRVKWVLSRVNSRVRYVVFHHQIQSILLVALKVISSVGLETLSQRPSKLMLGRCRACIKNKIISFRVAMMV